MESLLTLSTISGGRQVEPAQTVVGKWEGRSPDLWAALDFELFFISLRYLNQRNRAELIHDLSVSTWFLDQLEGLGRTGSFFLVISIHPSRRIELERTLLHPNN